MVEALGVASGVAGLISLRISACQGILAYYNVFRDSREDIDQMCASMENVAKTLLPIDLTIHQGHFDQNIIAAVESSIILCTQGIHTLKKKLNKIRSTETDSTLKTRLRNTKRRLLYPFKESTLAKLKEICHDLKTNLGLAIDALNVQVSQFNTLLPIMLMISSHTAFIIQQRLDILSHLTSAVSKIVGTIAADIANVTVNVGVIRLE